MVDTGEDFKALVSKISHDLRNSLAIIYSNAQLLQLMVEKQPQESETAKELITSVEQMTALLTQKMDVLKNIHENIRDTRE